MGINQWHDEKLLLHDPTVWLYPDRQPNIFPESQSTAIFLCHGEVAGDASTESRWLELGTIGIFPAAIDRIQILDERTQTT